ncbi:hypothetical protein P4114_25065 [Pseudomonas aeruginosa]|nr:hypothetical protein [Pseudomonas aeruginosa]
MPSSKPLAEYARKRDFRQTPEPSGRKPRKDSTGLLRYCVQKHETPAACTTTSAWSWMAP